MVDDVSIRLRQAMPGLRPAERRIADAVLADPAQVAELSITELAALCETSAASVARLTRALGFTGYKAFRIALARDGAGEARRRLSFGSDTGDIEPNDDAATVVRKLAYHEARAIEETAAGLDLDQLQQVVHAIAAAPSIDLYGAASSGLAGLDLQQKLRRIGLQANAWTDAHLALTSAAVLRSKAVAMVFSHSGTTSESVAVLRTAQRSGAFTVAVTNYPKSSIARYADAVLTTVSRETRFRSGAMASRMAQLTIVDILFLQVAQRDPERVTQSLHDTFEAVQRHAH
ncbi:MurR/RpiR family transcriptional regulator [Curtobacterium luteum]|uniref:MurR/RpiR family transcriptional regulator n=1 Tax=Curtobacterium luteum TaxID=33881 RepID=UPI0038129556